MKDTQHNHRLMGIAGDQETRKYYEGLLKPSRYDPERKERADAVREVGPPGDILLDLRVKFINCGRGARGGAQSWCAMSSFIEDSGCLLAFFGCLPAVLDQFGHLGLLGRE
jgi:hypothetical protein